MNNYNVYKYKILLCLQNALHGNYKFNKHTWYPNYFTYCASFYETCNNIAIQQLL